MELLDRILAKTAVTNAQAILESISERISKKDPNNEIILRIAVLRDDLNATRLFLMDSGNTIYTLREQLLTSEKMRIEKDKEIETLKKQLAELKDLL
jgi:predicted mannosyl-3-phosphoglycerate phosphatase (HAD superfamily)